MDGRLLVVMPYLTWITSPPWGDYGGWQWGEAPNLSGVEFYVTPFDDLVHDDPDRSRRSVLESGRIIGFQLIFYDRDAESTEIYSTAVAIQNPSYNHTFFAENFVDGELVPCHHEDCTGARTAVTPSSWGRIKAGFQ